MFYFIPLYYLQKHNSGKKPTETFSFDLFTRLQTKILNVGWNHLPPKKLNTFLNNFVSNLLKLHQSAPNCYYDGFVFHRCSKFDRSKQTAQLCARATADMTLCIFLLTFKKELQTIRFSLRRRRRKNFKHIPITIQWPQYYHSIRIGQLFPQLCKNFIDHAVINYYTFNNIKSCKWVN